MERRQLLFEEAGGQRLPLGGVNGYLGVRGKQGKNKDKYQGTTPRKQHRTGHFPTAKEAAIALAQMKEDLELGIFEERGGKNPSSTTVDDSFNKAQVGVYLGDLLRQEREGVPCVRAVLLSPQQAAAAVARGVALAYAEVIE